MPIFTQNVKHQGERQGYFADIVQVAGNQAQALAAVVLLFLNVRQVSTD
jgi:hypothetical protein